MNEVPVETPIEERITNYAAIQERITNKAAIEDAPIQERITNKAAIDEAPIEDPALIAKSPPIVVESSVEPVKVYRVNIQ